MRPRRARLAASLVGGLAGVAIAALAPLAPAPAGAASALLSTDFSCYLEGRVVKLTGTGFQPGASYNVLRDGTHLGDGTVDGAGNVSGTLASGRLSDGETGDYHLVTVTDGANSATVGYSVSAFGADFEPRAGNPRSLRVRFSVWGFAPGSIHRKTLYIHYVGPRSSRARDLIIGETHLPCGSISVTRERHLFPFTARAGTWKLQFDTHRHYDPRTRPRVVRTVIVR